MVLNQKRCPSLLRHRANSVDRQDRPGKVRGRDAFLVRKQEETAPVQNASLVSGLLIVQGS